MTPETAPTLECLAETIVGARTFADLADLRRQLAQLPLAADDRQVLETACAKREQSLIHFYLPHLA